MKNNIVWAAIGRPYKTNLISDKRIAENNHRIGVI